LGERKDFKVNRTNSLILMLIVSAVVLVFMGANLALPTDSYAHPSYGFTPEAPPPPGGNDDDADDDDGGGSGKGQDEPDYVWVELDHCDLSCSANYASKPGGLASPLSTPAEVRVRVQLIHQGSGWIAEGVISDAGSTRLTVPYPGQWEILMIREPEFVGIPAFDATNLNLEQLRNDLTVAPVSLGLVEANTPEPQLIKCPIACVIEPSPENLPETGSNRSAAYLVFLVGAIFIIILGVLMARLGSRVDSNAR
jgi:hypothetical protein